MWQRKTVVVIMTVNKAQLKSVYSTSWCRTVLIEERDQICFMLVPVSGMVIMASFKLSGELMQEIHQI